jgi:hypothetical protein
MPQEEPVLTEHHILPVLRYKLSWGERVETYGYPFSTLAPDELLSQYKSVTFSPVFLRGYVTQVVPNMNGVLLCTWTCLVHGAQRRAGHPRGPQRGSWCRGRGPDHRAGWGVVPLRRGAAAGRAA